MSGRRLSFGPVATLSLPLAVQNRFARVVSTARRLAASWTTAMLGRADLPTIGELAALRPATRVLMAGLAGWIGLVGLVTVVAVVSVEMSTISLPAWFSAPASKTRGTEASSPAGFENIVQRPLFSRNRHALTAAVMPSPAPPPPSALDPNITLKGVFISGPLEHFPLDMVHYAYPACRK
jgi:hypothetical protein